MTQKIKIWKNIKSTWRYYLFTYVHINQGHMMYGSWNIKCKGQIFLSFWAMLLPFDPPNNPKNQNLEKIKKFLKILSFYTCVPQMTTVMHGFWCIKHDRQDFLSFWAIFCPFTPLTIQKINILKKWKKLLEISFTQVHHMIYGSWDINCNRHISFVIFYHFFSCFTLIAP